MSTATLKGQHSHIYSRDPAVEGTPEARAEVAEKFNSGKLSLPDVPLRAGRQPAVWKLRSLTFRGYADLSRVSISESLRALASRDTVTLAARATFTELADTVRRGLVGVENALDRAGKPLDELKTEPAPGEQTVLTQASLEMLFAAFGPGLIRELGERVLAETELDPL